MAKKRANTTNDKPDGDVPASVSGAVELSDVPLVSEPGPEIILPADEDAGEEPEPLYTKGEWRGHTQFRCTLCPWDTLNGEAAMLMHIANAHMPPTPPASQSGLLLADKHGQIKE